MAGSWEQEKQLMTTFRDSVHLIFSSLLMDNFMPLAGENITHMRFNPGTKRATTRQVSSLQDLALNCSIRHWWKTENPARHLTVPLVNIMHTLKKVDLLPRPGTAHPAEDLRQAVQALQLRNNVVSLESLHKDLISAQKRLETAPASLPGLAKAVPKELPLQLRNSWYMAALALLNSLTDWLLQLCQVYYFNDVSVRYARFFLSRIVVKSTGEMDRARTVLNVLEDSMFHPGMNPCMFSVCNIGVRHIDLVEVSKRVMYKLEHGAAVPQLARTPTGPKDVIQQMQIHISLNQRMQSFARSVDGDMTVNMQNVPTEEIRNVWEGVLVVCAGVSPRNPQNRPPNPENQQNGRNRLRE